MGIADLPFSPQLISCLVSPRIGKEQVYPSDANAVSMSEAGSGESASVDLNRTLFSQGPHLEAETDFLDHRC